MYACSYEGFNLCDISLSMVCIQEPINKSPLKRIKLSIILWENEGKKTNQEFFNKEKQWLNDANIISGRC